FIFFFFSSRRRHTRFSRDWSSDVCSSDLGSFVKCRGSTNHRFYWERLNLRSYATLIWQSILYPNRVGCPYQCLFTVCRIYYRDKAFCRIYSRTSYERPPPCDTFPIDVDSALAIRCRRHPIWCITCHSQQSPHQSCGE